MVLNEGPGRRTPPTADHAQDVYDAFVSIMTQAMNDSELTRRLASAEVVANIHLRDSPQDLVLALHLDRTPIELTAGAVPGAEVDLFIDTDDVMRFWTGEINLAMRILHGDIAYEGPVRKLLRVVPIARRLVSDFQAQAAASGLLDVSATTTTRTEEPR
ncbi:hypothetical protein [Paraconexibacter algicola]|uniref:SCP2 domain-containing protein n=1 Tax=Paraconexibacter algicola TaxID=2133960 RepID=A0A2T4UK07_9ACTN|nr:hypothetical protein [Paraconexibacter algicola]PTL59569.1 hypothetical protein C7Y72_07865 [Paraconexibacter algicola]